MPRNLRKRGRVWWFKIRHGGKDHEGSLQTDNLSIAKSRVEAVRKDLTASKFGEKPIRTFDEAARRFSAEHYKTLRPSSRKRYAVSLVNLTDHFQGVRLIDIGSALLGDFERARLATGVTSSTVRRDLACLSSVFGRAEEWEWVTSNPVKPFKRGRGKAGLREGAARTRYLSPGEEAAVLGKASPRLKAAMMFAIDTGLRKEEQFSLTWADVDLDAREITVRAEIAKSGKARRVPLQDRARDVLLALARGLGEVPVFQTEAGARYGQTSHWHYDGLQAACKRAGVKRCSWHDMRRTCGCRLLQDLHLRIEAVSEWLGHGDVRITQQRYAFLKIDMLHDAIRTPSQVIALGQKRGQKSSEA